MTSTPRVSLVLPSYNGIRYLKESVDSCLQQSFEDLELVVVLDGSTDGSAALLESYRDPRLRIVKTENQGLPKALNTGFSHCRGSLWSWTSDDNLYERDAIRVMVDHLDAHPRAPMVCTDVTEIDGDGKVTGYGDDTWACFLYRAEAARAAGPYRTEFALVEDVDFFLRLQHCAGPIERIRQPHYRYRVHQATLSHRRIAERALASLKLHYDLATRGIEQLDLRELFFNRLSSAAMKREPSLMDGVIDFAVEKQVPFLAELKWRRRILETTPGWLWNRALIAARTRAARVRKRLASLERRLRGGALA